MVHALNGDYSTESAHKRFLFTSCDASKKNEQSEAKCRKFCCIATSE